MILYNWEMVAKTLMVLWALIFSINEFVQSDEPVAHPVTYKTSNASIPESAILQRSIDSGRIELQTAKARFDAAAKNIHAETGHPFGN